MPYNEFMTDLVVPRNGTAETVDRLVKRCTHNRPSVASKATPKRVAILPDKPSDEGKLASLYLSPEEWKNNSAQANRVWAAAVAKNLAVVSVRVHNYFYVARAGGAAGALPAHSDYLLADRQHETQADRLLREVMEEDPDCGEMMC